MHELRVSKCQPSLDGDPPTEDAIISISLELPIMSVSEGANFYLAQAAMIEASLHRSLPGGTYDRVCELMLGRKASHFRVGWEKFGE